MTVNEIAEKYDMKISSSKTKGIELCGKNMQMVKTDIQGKIIEQVAIYFNYLTNSMASEPTVHHHIHKFPPLVSIQLNPPHNPTENLPMIDPF
jgi:hypothetical protein